MRPPGWTRLPSLLAALLMAGVAGTAAARTMTMMDTYPAANAVLDGRITHYVVRFDGPVDHGQSLLTVIHDGKIIRSFRPLLDSQPNTLFSSGGPLDPGAYELHWYVRSPGDAEVTHGHIAFTVQATAPAAQ